MIDLLEVSLFNFLISVVIYYYTILATIFSTLTYIISLTTYSFAMLSALGSLPDFR